jgi:hypothetical protein
MWACPPIAAGRRAPPSRSSARLIAAWARPSTPRPWTSGRAACACRAHGAGDGRGGCASTSR